MLAETITIAVGETKIIRYTEQIVSDTTFTFTFSGDLNQTIAKTVLYGLSALLELSVSDGRCKVVMPDNRICPEGYISIPISIANTGLLDADLLISYQIMRDSEIITTFSRSYYIGVGSVSPDALEFTLAEVDYSLLATSQFPTATAQVNFSVRKENLLTAAIMIAQSDGSLFPVVVDVSNLGINDFIGTLQLSVISNQNEIVWSASKSISLPSNPLNPTPASYDFNIDASVIPQGNYNVKAEVLANNNFQIASAYATISIGAAEFVITQLPAYQTFPAGQEAVLDFNIRNTGNHAGYATINLKAYDLIDLTQTESLNAGEEKTVTFSFLLPEDIEAKDYFADYIMRDEQTSSVVAYGNVRYGVSGLKVSVGAQLDKQNYNDGDTFYLMLTVSNQGAGDSYSLIARVNYSDYESQQSFILNGTQVLTFEVPLVQVTGEKLAYGIYYESGRSVYLNSIFVHKVGEVISIATDKQVYNEGETVTVQITGSASGQMTLNGPGGYSESFQYDGSAVKYFTLPSAMVSGAYAVD